MNHAADVWFFVAAMMWLIAGVCIYYSTGGDEKDSKPEDYIFNPKRHRSKYVAPRSLDIANKLKKGD